MAYLESRQFDLDMELQAERRAGYCNCPQCGGIPDYDSDGRPFTCYYCCDTGSVPAEVAAQWERDEADAREYAPLRRVVDGKHMVPRYDGETGCGWDEPQSLLPLELIFPRMTRRELPAAFIAFDDDIPF
jgi:hypothetical protein